MGVLVLAAVGILLSSCTDKTVFVVPLTCSAAPELTDGPLPLQVCLIQAVVGGTGPYDYSWDLGDGGTSTEANPCYTYQDIGTYIDADRGGLTSTLGGKS